MGKRPFTPPLPPRSRNTVFGTFRHGRAFTEWFIEFPFVAFTYHHGRLLEFLRCKSLPLTAGEVAVSLRASRALFTLRVVVAVAVVGVVLGGECIERVLDIRADEVVDGGCSRDWPSSGSCSWRPA